MLQKSKTTKKKGRLIREIPPLGFQKQTRLPHANLELQVVLGNNVSNQFGTRAYEALFTLVLGREQFDCGSKRSARPREITERGPTRKVVYPWNKMEHHLSYIQDSQLPGHMFAKNKGYLLNLACESKQGTQIQDPGSRPRPWPWPAGREHKKAIVGISGDRWDPAF